MKNRLFTGFMAALSLIIAIELRAPFATAAEAEFTLVHVDQESEWYINTLTLISPSPGKISFWNKIVPTKGSTYSARVGEMLKKAGKDPDRLEYLQTLEEVDCAKNTSRVWSLMFYDRQDRIVLSKSASKAALPVMAMGSEADMMRKMVCTSALQETNSHDFLGRSEGVHLASIADREQGP